jgi:hypothetical protein
MTEKTSVSERTITQTVWSDSVLESLVQGLKEGKADEWICQQVASIEKRANIPVEYLIFRAHEDLGPEYAERLKKATHFKMAGAAQARKSRKSGGNLLSKFVALLKK